MKNVEEYIKRKKFVIKTLQDLIIKTIKEENILDITEIRKDYYILYSMKFETIDIEVEYPRNDNITNIRFNIPKFSHKLTIDRKEFSEKIGLDFMGLCEEYKQMASDGEAINKLYTLFTRKDKLDTLNNIEENGN
jgi:hypothetical protein